MHHCFLGTPLAHAGDGASATYLTPTQYSFLLQHLVLAGQILLPCFSLRPLHGSYSASTVVVLICSIGVPRVTRNSCTSPEAPSQGVRNEAGTGRHEGLLSAWRMRPPQRPLAWRVPYASRPMGSTQPQRPRARSHLFRGTDTWQPVPTTKCLGSA